MVRTRRGSTTRGAPYPPRGRPVSTRAASTSVLSISISHAGPAFSTLHNLVSTLLGVQSGHYTYMDALRQLDHSPTTIPTLPRWTTPIQIPVLASLLSTHPDHDFVSYILRGLSGGFHVGFDERMVHLRSSHRNHPSSLANRTVVSTYIQEEAVAGRMIGPLSTPAQHLVHCSPIGLVPKGRNTGQWRMIVDLSYPKGESVNDGVPASLCSLSYASVENATQFIKVLGHGTLLIKIDLKSAYRIVPIHLDDRHLFGIEWNGQVFIDQALPFGLRSAPKLFTAVADAIGWALAHTGIPLHLHYLDDFLFLSPPTATQYRTSRSWPRFSVFPPFGCACCPTQG